jgi:hypothetical protein
MRTLAGIVLLDSYQAELRIKPLQIEWVARDHRESRYLRTHHDMRIGDVCGSGLPKQHAYGLSV